MFTCGALLFCVLLFSQCRQLDVRRLRRWLYGITTPYHLAKQWPPSFRYHRYHIHPPCCVVVIYAASLHRSFLFARKCFLAFKRFPIHSFVVQRYIFSSKLFYNSNRFRKYALTFHASFAVFYYFKERLL